MRTSLRLVAEQLRLAYYVNQGNVIISSHKIIQQRAEKTESEAKTKKDEAQEIERNDSSKPVGRLSDNWSE